MVTAHVSTEGLNMKKLFIGVAAAAVVLGVSVFAADTAIIRLGGAVGSLVGAFVSSANAAEVDVCRTSEDLAALTAAGCDGEATDLDPLPVREARLPRPRPVTVIAADDAAVLATMAMPPVHIEVMPLSKALGLF